MAKIHYYPGLLLITISSFILNRKILSVYHITAVALLVFASWQCKQSLQSSLYSFQECQILGQPIEPEVQMKSLVTESKVMSQLNIYHRNKLLTFLVYFIYSRKIINVSQKNGGLDHCRIKM